MKTEEATCWVDHCKAFFGFLANDQGFAAVRFLVKMGGTRLEKNGLKTHCLNLFPDVSLMHAVKRKLAFMITTLVLAGGIYLGKNGGVQRIFQPETWEDTKNQREIMLFLNRHYSSDWDKRDLKGQYTDQHINRILHAMDPYSDYLSKDEFSNFEKETSQQYVGIGVQIANYENDVVITKVFPSSPAEEIGLQSGDRIISVDGTNTRNSNVSRVVKLISGRPGTTVELDIFRPFEKEVITVNPERRSIVFASIVDVQMLDDQYGYLKIIEFGERTGREFDRALDRLEAQGMEGLIIDLRNNPGGMLTAAVRVAGQFFRRGEVVVEVKGFGVGEDEVYRSRSRERKRDYPIVVLQNRGSASASEIVAGSLRATDRAVIIGDRSYGKGTVQSIFALSNGEGLRMTTARYYLPDGEPIRDGVGLVPDVSVPIDFEDSYKLQIQEFYGLAHDPEAFEQRFGFAPVEDKQVSAAVAYLGNKPRG